MEESDVFKIKNKDVYLFIYLFVNLQVGAQLILLHLRGDFDDFVLIIRLKECDRVILSH